MTLNGLLPTRVISAVADFICDPHNLAIGLGHET